MYRQGDVLIERVARMPKGGKAIKPEHGRIVLAHGEATGHHHSVAVADVAESIVDETGALFLRFCRDSIVTHQEHAPVDIPAGTYRVTRQREYSPQEIGNVAD